MKSILKSILVYLLVFNTDNVNAQIGVYPGQPLFSLPVLVLDANPKSIDSKNASGQSGSNSQRGIAAKSSLAYTPTPALKKATVDGYVERLKAKNPEAAKAIADNFGTGKYDYGTIYNGLVKGNGLQENDAVDAMTAYMVLGYMIVNNVQDGNAITPAMAQRVRAQFGPQLAQHTAFKQAGVSARLGEEMKLQFVVVQGGWQAAVKENTVAAYRQGIAQIFKAQTDLDFTKLKITNQGFIPNGQVTSKNQPTSNSGNQQVINTATPGVEGWFFRAVSGYPAAVSFEPVVLFKNGTYYEISDQPLENLDVAEAKQKKPDAWGTWKKNGAVFILTNAKNQSNDYTLGSGNWFPAYPYSASIPLKKGYEKVSGGDYGAGTSVLAISKINFLDAIHFSQGSDVGISSPNAAGGNKSSASGTYKLNGHTLELTYSDGKSVKKSFALGATGSPAKPTNTMIFIGGDAYTDTE